MNFFNFSDLETFKALTVMVFIGFFGYAYCKQNKDGEDIIAVTFPDSIDNEDFSFTKKDQKALNKLKKNLEKLEDKMKKMEVSGNLLTSSSAVVSPSNKQTYASIAASSNNP